MTWLKDNQAQPQHADKLEFSGPSDTLKGAWRVTVVFETPEVRRDPNNLLTSSDTFDV